MVDFLENPITLVEVRGISKRSRRPIDLTIDQFFLIWGLIAKIYQVMTRSTNARDFAPVSCLLCEGRK